MDNNKDKDSRPVPDPTFLTTQQLNREILSLKEVVFTRLEGMDKAIELFNANITRVPTDTDKQIQHLKQLHEEKFQSTSNEFKGKDKLYEEKFSSIETQFKERDTRTEQTARDSKVAVDAALQAAKEAVGEQNKSSALAISKSEAATVKQIDQIQTLITSSNSALDDKISDIKERLTRIEGSAVGRVAEQMSQDTSNRTHESTNGLAVAIFSSILSLIAVIVVIAKALTGH